MGSAIDVRELHFRGDLIHGTIEIFTLVFLVVLIFKLTPLTSVMTQRITTITTD